MELSSSSIQNNPKSGTRLSTHTCLDSRVSAETLKGFAISVVLINHYLNHYVSGDSGGFANAIVSLFFLLSGYGISKSLSKRDFNLSFSVLGGFYQRRISKIFPLFWIALFAQSFISSQFYSFSTFLGFRAEEHYWFISSILQCYLLSPFLFLFLKKSRKFAIVIITVVFILVVSFSIYFDSFKEFVNLLHLSDNSYLDIPFLDVYIFFLGICCENFGWVSHQTRIEKYLPRKFCYTIFYKLCILIILVLVIDKYYFDIGLISGLILIMAIKLYTMRNKIEIPILTFLGKMSFQLYLFHMTYYIFLERIGTLKQDSLLSLLVMLFLFPSFVFMLTTLEKVISKLTIKSMTFLK